MSSTEKDFFSGKRKWSRLKDQVLRDYLPPYLKKLNKFGKTIILIDSFAGPGLFKENNEEGSPLIFCKIAEQLVPDNYLAVLVNKKQKHHVELTKNLEKFITSKKAFTILGNADDLLNELYKIIKDQTLFIYLDPFGLKGTDFQTILKFFERDKKYSTEILINLSIPTIIRYTCINKYKLNGLTPDIEIKHSIITKALGGEYWKDFMLDTEMSSNERQSKIISEYIIRLQKLMPYVGYCPVYEKSGSERLKYIIILASRHPDAQFIMNDIMYNAYHKYIWEGYSSGTLFEDLNYDDFIPNKYYNSLEKDILRVLNSKGKMSRKELWKDFTLYRFMRYHSKHYRAKIRELVAGKILSYDDIRKTGNLNNDSILFLTRRNDGN